MIQKRFVIIDPSVIRIIIYHILSGEKVIACSDRIIVEINEYYVKESMSKLISQLCYFLLKFTNITIK